jgi:hypothetical protein
MNYRCPSCDTDLKNRYLPTKGLGATVVKLPSPINKAIKQRVPVCPKCNTALSINTHPVDQALARWAALPLVLFFAGLFLESLAIRVVAGAVLALGAAWSVWAITRPSYKEWRYWRVYTVGGREDR